MKLQFLFVAFQYSLVSCHFISFCMDVCSSSQTIVHMYVCVLQVTPCWTMAITQDKMKKLSPSELCSHLIDALGDSVSGSVLDSLEEQRVSGPSLLELRDEDLQEVTSLLGDRVTLRNYIDSFNTSTKVNLNANLKFLVTQKVGW